MYEVPLPLKHKKRRVRVPSSWYCRHRAMHSAQRSKKICEQDDFHDLAVDLFRRLLAQVHCEIDDVKELLAARLEAAVQTKRAVDQASVQHAPRKERRVRFTRTTKLQ